MAVKKNKGISALRKLENLEDLTSGADLNQKTNVVEQEKIAVPKKSVLNCDHRLDDAEVRWAGIGPHDPRRRLRRLCLYHHADGKSGKA